MYRCYLCKKTTAPREPIAMMLTVEERFRKYPFRPKANRPIRIDDRNICPDDPGGEGYEVVKERPMCTACTTEYTSITGLN